MFSGYFIGVVAVLAALGVAKPVDIRGKSEPPNGTEDADGTDVSTSVLDELDVFAQWSAAAYCSDNINNDDTTVKCSDNACPSVEAASTKMLLEFDLYVPLTTSAGPWLIE